MSSRREDVVKIRWCEDGATTRLVFFSTCRSTRSLMHEWIIPMFRITLILTIHPIKKNANREEKRRSYAVLLKLDMKLGFERRRIQRDFVLSKSGSVVYMP